MPTDHVTVQRALQRAIDLGEGGLQVAAYLGEDLIVDQWAGTADRAAGRPVDGDTLFSVFSVTKGVTAAAINIQAERGLVDLDAPVADYWPEFAANGKAAITIRHVLSHRSGIPQMPAGVTTERMCDWAWMIRGLENEAPLFPTDTVNAYHSLIWGWIVAEVVVRADPARRPFQRWIIEEICGPLGIEDLHLGIPPSAAPRVATLIGERIPPDIFHAVPPPVNPNPAIYNQPMVRQACLPGAGVIANARSMARFWAMIANGGQLGGVRLLQENTLRNGLALRKFPLDLDLTVKRTPWVGRAGWWVGGPGNRLVGESPNILQNPGAGGSIGFADLDRRLAVSITHTNMDADPEGFIGVADAVRAVAA